MTTKLLFKAAKLIIKGVAQHRASTNLKASIGDKEQELYRATATHKNGMFSSSEGILAITTYGVRFQQTTIIGNEAMLIPSSDILRISSDPGMFWGGTVHIKTNEKTHSFEFGSTSHFDKVRELVE